MPAGTGCGQVRRELEAFALGELSPRDRHALARHLRSCPHCAREASEVVAILRDLRAVAGLGAAPSPRPRLAAAAALAAGVLVMVGVTLGERWPRAAPAAHPAPLVAEVAGLLASQDEDGAWRDPGCGSPSFTVGVSALATLACLEAPGDDPRILAAGERGCRWLVGALGDGAVTNPDVSIELRLRAQAAAAWALGAAARLWPDRYGSAAGEAMADLRELSESWGGSAGGSVPGELTSLLVAAASRQGGRTSPDPAAEAAPFAARLVASADVVPGGAPPASVLATRLLATARGWRGSDSL